MNPSSNSDLRLRTQDFALRIIRLYRAMPKGNPGHTLGLQLLRSGTSVGAHYAEAFRAKSRLDFINKIVGATEELEESSYWIQLLIRSDIVSEGKLRLLKQELSELMAIFVTMIKHTKERSQSK